jgi:hypothetical protein
MNKLKTTKNWDEIFDEWISSGKNQKTFCQDKGIPFSTFRYYREKTKTKTDRRRKREGFHAVEIGRFYPMLFSKVPIFLGSEGITITVCGEDATVRVQGRVTLERMGRIIMACGGADEAKARDAQD